MKKARKSYLIYLMNRIKKPVSLSAYLEPDWEIAIRVKYVFKHLNTHCYESEYLFLPGSNHLVKAAFKIALKGSHKDS